MKATDLMLGDWVQYTYTPYGQNESRTIVFQVSEIERFARTYFACSTKYGRVCEVEKLQPIPLTAEILEKNGFQWGYTSDEEDIQAVGEGDFEKGWVWDEGAGSVKVIFPDGTDSGEVVIDDQRFDKIIQFLWKEIINVHQLQNALRLCGIEHEIIL